MDQSCLRTECAVSDTPTHGDKIDATLCALRTKSTMRRPEGLPSVRLHKRIALIYHVCFRPKLHFLPFHYVVSKVGPAKFPL